MEAGTEGNCDGSNPLFMDMMRQLPDSENPYAAAANGSQRGKDRWLVDSQTARLFVVSCVCVIAVLFQLSETTTRGFGQRSEFGFPVFLILDHGASREVVEFRMWPAVANLGVIVLLALLLIPAARSARWFRHHKSAAASLSLLGMMIGCRDLIDVSESAMWLIDSVTFLALLVLPWAVAHTSNSYALALIAPFGTTIVWGTFSRAAELYRGIYDTQSMLSAVHRSAVALALSTLAASSIFLRRRRTAMQKQDT
jgi:hypothetical protein